MMDEKAVRRIRRRTREALEVVADGLEEIDAALKMTRSLRVRVKLFHLRDYFLTLKAIGDFNVIDTIGGADEDA